MSNTNRRPSFGFLKNAENCNAACNHVQDAIMTQVFCTTRYSSVIQLLNVANMGKASVSKILAQEVIDAAAKTYPWVEDMPAYVHILQGEGFAHLTEHLTLSKAVERMAQCVREQHPSACPTKDQFADWLMANCSRTIPGFIVIPDSPTSTPAPLPSLQSPCLNPSQPSCLPASPVAVTVSRDRSASMPTPLPPPLSPTCKSPQDKKKNRLTMLIDLIGKDADSHRFSSKEPRSPPAKFPKSPSFSLQNSYSASPSPKRLDYEIFSNPYLPPF